MKILTLPPKSAFILALGLSMTLFLPGCDDTTKQGRGSSSVAVSQQSLADSDVQALEAQQARAIKVEITCCAPVVRLLPDDTRGLPHQKFILQLSNGTTVLVAHDTKMAPRVPLQVGDRPILHGEYIWNPKGGLIHWTHHTDTPRHEGGWIMLNGQKYE